MFIASTLKRTNIGQYILYMWQTEDFLRAFNFDTEALTKYMCSAADRDGHPYSDQQSRELQAWYDSLADMLISEGHRDTGHLSMVHNTLMEMEELHQTILRMGKDAEYINTYRMIQSELILLKSRSQKPATISDMEMCMTFIYITRLLKHSNNVSPQTTATYEQINILIGMLAKRYKEWKENDEEIL